MRQANGCKLLLLQFNVYFITSITTLILPNVSFLITLFGCTLSHILHMVDFSLHYIFKINNLEALWYAGLLGNTVTTLGLLTLKSTVLVSNFHFSEKNGKCTTVFETGIPFLTIQDTCRKSCGAIINNAGM